MYKYWFSKTQHRNQQNAKATSNNDDEDDDEWTTKEKKVHEHELLRNRLYRVTSNDAKSDHRTCIYALHIYFNVIMCDSDSRQIKNDCVLKSTLWIAICNFCCIHRIKNHMQMNDSMQKLILETKLWRKCGKKRENKWRESAINTGWWYPFELRIWRNCVENQ